MLLKPFMREGIMPLPVTFISTISRTGIRNIAPWSCVMPVLRPLDLICAASAKRRDTLQNIRETGQFVINLAGAEMVDKVIPTARHSPPDVDEFLAEGIEEKPSVSIKAPGIKGCYAWMECDLIKEYEEDKFVLILGRVLRLEVDDRVLNADGSLNIEKAMPLMMTGSRKGIHFSTIKDLAHHEPFSAMFPDGKDPLGSLYKK
ncbi:MAG: flavin reductase family protein [Deltaproteobacteria bacterium]|nr:flavin reductase family protein [Deltaproteobacteria bacterium]